MALFFSGPWGVIGKQFLIIILACSVAFPLRAEENFGQTYSNTRPGVWSVGEAATSIFGRVFGVGSEEAAINYHVFELDSHSPGHAAIRSAFVPGWGQWFNGQSVKGTVMFIGFTAALAGSLSRYQASRNSYDEYKDLGNQNHTSFDDYESERSQALILGGVAAVIYGFSVIDAYHHAYSPLWSRDSGVKFAVGTDEGRIYWEKKF